MLVQVQDSSSLIDSDESGALLDYEGLEFPSSRLINKEFAHYLVEIGDFERLRSEFVKYRDDDRYLVVGCYPVDGSPPVDRAILTSKRGNSRYVAGVERRFNTLVDLDNIVYFNPYDRSSHHKTSALFISLTYNRDEHSLDDAWLNCGVDVNRYISMLRSRYGKCSSVRTLEVQYESGVPYPHIHLIVVFENYSFDTYFYNGRWLITENNRDDNGVNKMEWNEGFVKILGMSNISNSALYITKYMRKCVGSSSGSSEYSETADMTQAMCWLYSVRSYGFQGRKLLDLIRSSRNSNPSGVFLAYQLTLSGDRAKIPCVYVPKGFCRVKFGGRWGFDVSKILLKLMKRSSTWVPFIPRIKDSVELINGVSVND